MNVSFKFFQEFHDLPDASPYGMNFVVPGCVQVEFSIDSTNLIESTPRIFPFIDLLYSINISDAHFIWANAYNIAVVSFV